MQWIDKLYVLEPIERVCLLKLPAYAFVFGVPHGATRAHNPSFNRRDKRNPKEILRHWTRNRVPRHSTIRRMKNRSLVADDPSGSLCCKGDCVERRSRS